jgi:hypothetical protein
MHVLISTRTGLGGQAPHRTVATAPRWAKVLGPALAAFVLLVCVMALFGAHGPGVH